MEFTITELDYILFALGNVVSIQMDPEVNQDLKNLIEKFIEERDFKISDLIIG